MREELYDPCRCFSPTCRRRCLPLDVITSFIPFPHSPLSVNLTDPLCEFLGAHHALGTIAGKAGGADVTPPVLFHRTIDPIYTTGGAVPAVEAGVVREDKPLG